MSNQETITDPVGRVHKQFYNSQGKEIIKHCEEEGCLLVLQRKELKTPSSQGSVGHLLKFYVCLTHNVEVCKCGIPYGRHEEYATKKENEKIALSLQNGEPVGEETSYFDEYQASLSE